jgi:hypothetical protein
MYYDKFPNPRLGIEIGEYIQKCDALTGWFTGSIDLSAIEGKSVLALGTEEFMYQALVLGKQLEQYSKSVVSHSTTRSPLLPGNNPDYPFYSRTAFTSIYDNERITYLYNLERYDTVIIVTDAVTDADNNPDGLLDAVKKTKCEKIYMVRVCGVC